MKQNRFKSWAMWTAVVAQTLVILLATGAIAPELGETIKLIAGSVLQILVLFGVLNNPTDKDNF